MDSEDKTRRLAIACQGGGSHTAFTAGVLKRILKDLPEKYEIMALSGASGSAICALLAWYGLLQNDREKAVKLLESFWEANSADTFEEQLLNNWVLATSQLQGFGLALTVSPYFYPPWAGEKLRRLIEAHVDFDGLEDLVKPSSPGLLVGAVEVLSGEFRVFDSRSSVISADAILASAALPTLFRAVNIEGEVFWDGLFSHNPPVRDFLADRPLSEKPDEVWIVQINPERRDSEPTSMLEIADRRNELAGNLSLNQEISFIEAVNKLVDHLPADEYKPVTVRRIEMLRDLDHVSKLDRSPRFIRGMIAYGEERTREFLRRLP